MGTRKWCTCATYNTSAAAVLEAPCITVFVLSLGYDRLEGSLVLKHKDNENEKADPELT